MDAAAAFANRVLERETWARQRLAVHAGRTFVIVAPPVVAPFRIGDTGLLAAHALSESPADLRVSIQPWAVPGLLADPTRWDAAITTDGDPALASTLRELAQTAPFWIEQFLSRWLGPVAGQRLADGGRRMLGLPEHVIERLSDSISSYLADQLSVVARGDEARGFADQVSVLSRRVQDLDGRIDGLLARLGARMSPHG